MRYKNIKTGAIIDSPFNISGKYWQEYDLKKKAKTKEEYVEEEINLDDMTKSELVDLANEHEIEVNERDTKAVIIKAITKAFE